MRTLGAAHAKERFTLPVAEGFKRPLERLTLAAFLLVAGGMAFNMGAYSSVAAAATPAMYYIAMGDSLGVGVGATRPANDYVNLLYQHELSRYPNLQVLNLSCSGATTTDVLRGGGGCTYTTGTQLGDAEAFLRAHPGQIAFLTIDIGLDNLVPCLYFFASAAIDGNCAHNALNVVGAELPAILDGLRSASPGLSVYGMDYYDPFLAGWLLGGSDQTLAQESVPYLVSLNTLLGEIYGGAGDSMADPAASFETTNGALAGSYLGMTGPQDVALVCDWTLMCAEHDVNIHTNDVGYAVLAHSFEQEIDQGYWEVASDGGVFSFGSAQFYGSMRARMTSGS